MSDNINANDVNENAVNSEEQNKKTDIPKSYKVEAGDTIKSIARKFGITTGHILKLNDHIKDPRELRIDDELKLSE